MIPFVYLLQCFSTLFLAYGLYVALKCMRTCIVAKGKKLPSPPSHWLLGNIPLMTKSLQGGRHIDELIAEWIPKIGKLFVFKLGIIDFVVVNDADAVREVGARTGPAQRWSPCWSPMVWVTSMNLHDTAACRSWCNTSQYRTTIITTACVACMPCCSG